MLRMEQSIDKTSAATKNGHRIKPGYELDEADEDRNNSVCSC